MRRRGVAWWRLATVAAVMLLMGVSTATTAISRVQEPAAARTTNDGVYIADQAAQGKTLFRDVCIICHPDPFWRPTWEGKPLSDLYVKILKFMPDDNPGSLSSREVTAALAYILESNGAPAGKAPLPADEQAVAAIRIVAPPK